MSASALYRGTVRHRRREPVAHEFRYRVSMLYLDLDEVPAVLDGRLFWSARRPALARFKRADYLGDPAVPLADAVRDLVAARTGRRPAGPIRLLAHLRHFGYVFNPVSFYYCFDGAASKVETIVAEITNTPWGERHAYVLEAARGESNPLRQRHRHRFRKEFHVSPFMPMEIDYDWRFTEPGRRLAVHMNCDRGGRRIFDATLALEREEIGAWSLARALVRHPFMTAKVTAAIHWQALRLAWKRCPFHPHPKKSAAESGARA